MSNHKRVARERNPELQQHDRDHEVYHAGCAHCERERGFAIARREYVRSLYVRRLRDYADAQDGAC